MSNIGIVYSRQCNFAKAIGYYETSLKIYSKLEGEDSFDAADTLYNIGLVYELEDQLNKA